MSFLRKIEDWYRINESIVNAFQQKTKFWVQPGYIGKDFKGLMFVAVRPGAPKDWNKEENRKMAASQDVEELDKHYLAMLKEHPLISKYVSIILKGADLDWDNVGWINLVKYAADDNVEPTQAEIDEAWAFTREQLKFAMPLVIVCVGKTSSDYLKYKSYTNIVESQHYAFMARNGMLDAGAHDVAFQVASKLKKTTLLNFLR